MGYDYALVHLKYTIPPAILLSLFYRPLFTRLSAYKISFIVLIALVATTPWDSYLIHSRVWSYPPNAIVGPTLFRIPAEEVFFFFIQTYTTSLLYLILSQATFHPVFLRGKSRDLQLQKWLGQGVIFVGIIMGGKMVIEHGEGFYLGLILVWAGPFLFLLWSLAYQFILGLPLTNTALPIVLPTLYLWIVDTIALRRGTWVIESGTKLGWHLWEGLDIEEAVFFLATNTLIVFGMVSFDNSLAVLYTFPDLFPTVAALPSPFIKIRALLTPTKLYDEARIDGMQSALDRLRRKSRSFYLASSVFQGRLRIDLILLYSFCRVADDLVDTASTVAEAKTWIDNLMKYLDISYGSSKETTSARDAFVRSTFPKSMQTSLLLLPTAYLSAQPLYDLLKGFEMDLEFSSKQSDFPIKDESELKLYGARVAGTVAELCIELVYHHTLVTPLESVRRNIVQAGGQMGIALQYVNIARDIAVDARIGRVYLPTSWLQECGVKPLDIIEDSESRTIEILRQRLLDKAMKIYSEARGAIEQLPSEARGPMRVAVESYMEIGRTLRKPGYKLKAGRATVPKLRRLQIAWTALSHP